MIRRKRDETTAASTGESSTIATPVSTSSRMLPTTSISTWRVKVVSGLHVRRQPRDQHTGALALEEGHGEPLEVLVRGDAEAAEEALARPRGAHDDEPLEQRAHEHEPEVGERGTLDRPFVAALDPLVDRVLEQRRPRDRDQRRADDPERGERDQAAGTGA